MHDYMVGQPITFNMKYKLSNCYTNLPLINDQSSKDCITITVELYSTHAMHVVFGKLQKHIKTHINIHETRNTVLLVMSTPDHIESIKVLS